MNRARQYSPNSPLVSNIQYESLCDVGIVDGLCCLQGSRVLMVVALIVMMLAANTNTLILSALISRIAVLLVLIVVVVVLVDKVVYRVPTMHHANQLLTVLCDTVIT